MYRQFKNAAWDCVIKKTNKLTQANNEKTKKKLKQKQRKQNKSQKKKKKKSQSGLSQFLIL